MLEVRVDGWKKAIRFSSAHATLNLGKCERLHGHTYVIHANAEGEIERRRVVLDFVELTRTLRDIADELDHYVLVPTEGAPHIRVDVKGDRVAMTAGDARYDLPRRDCYLLPRPSSTAEDLAEHVLALVRKRLRVPRTVTRLEIGVDEGYGQGAWATWTRGRGARGR